MPLNISIDVDGTLVDAEGQILPGAKEAVVALNSAGFALTIWSLAGATYAKAVAKKYEIEEFFVGFAGKPDIVIDDDMTSLHPKLKFAIKPETAWQTLLPKVLTQCRYLAGNDGDRKTLLKLIDDCQTQFAEFHKQYGKLLFPENLSLYPIPFFGNPIQAEILTVALNPAWTEFKMGRGWEEGFNNQRLLDKFLSYFAREPHSWFDPIEKGILYIGSSYEVNAAHVDLFPHPTLFARQMPDGQKTLFGELIYGNTNHLRQILKICRSVKMVIIIDYPYGKGSKFGVFETFQKISPAVAQISGGKFPVFRFPNPNAISDWSFKNRVDLRKHLRDADPIEF